MQSSGNSKRNRKGNSGDQEVKKRPNFALIGGIIGIVLVSIYLLTAFYPTSLLSKMKKFAVPVNPGSVLVNAHPDVPESPLKTSAESLFNNTTEVWTKLFDRMGKKYTPPQLQLFIDTIRAEGCGYLKPAAGSFYCPQYSTAYISLGDIDSIRRSHPSIAQFAQDYIIAHQVGHRVQQLLGTTGKIAAARYRVSYDEYKKMVQKAELQADYYAGVWAHYAWKSSDHLADFDSELGISLLSSMSAGMAQYPQLDVPGSFPDLNTEKRSDWFYKGYLSGDVKGGDAVFAKGELK